MNNCISVEFCSQQTWTMLTSAAFVHLKHADLSKHTRNLPAASRTILLSGPSGNYFSVLKISSPLLTLFHKYVIGKPFDSRCKRRFLYAELYQQTLAKALAHYFESKLLIIDIADFLLKVTRLGWFMINVMMLSCFYIMIILILFTDAKQVWLSHERIGMPLNSW